MAAKLVNFMTLIVGTMGISTAHDVPWTWTVSSFASVCTAATCRYSLKVAAPSGPAGEPSFDASLCSGTSIQAGYRPCGIANIGVPGTVQTRIINLGIKVGATVVVQYTFVADHVKYTYTGNNSVAHPGYGPPIDFTIFPSEIAAVPLRV